MCQHICYSFCFFSILCVQARADIIITLVPLNPLFKVRDESRCTEVPVRVLARLHGSGPSWARVRFARFDFSRTAEELGPSAMLTHAGVTKGDIRFWNFDSAPNCNMDEDRCGEFHIIEEHLPEMVLDMTYLADSSDNQIQLSVHSDVLLGMITVTIPNTLGTYTLDVLNASGDNGNPGAEFVLDTDSPAQPSVHLRASLGQIVGGALSVPHIYVPDCNENDFEDCNENGVPDICEPCSESSSDCNGNGVPDECDGPEAAIQIAFSDPGNARIDARQDRSLVAPTLQGPRQVRIGFNCVPIDAVTYKDFGPSSVTVTSTATYAPVVESVVKEDQTTYTIVFAEPIPPDAWTTVTLNVANRSGIFIDPDSDTVTLGFLPGDVNGNGHSSPADLIDLIDHLNGVRIPPLHVRQCDIDRSGACAAGDIVRMVDLLKGISTSRPWLGATLPVHP